MKSNCGRGEIHAILARVSEHHRVLLKDLRSHAGISTGRGVEGATGGGGGTKARREQLKEAARCRPLPWWRKGWETGGEGGIRVYHPAIVVGQMGFQATPSSHSLCVCVCVCVFVCVYE